MKSILCSLVIFAILWTFISTRTPDPDEDRNVPELMASRGFECETHFVTTKDGYILGIHRVVNPVLKKANKTLIRPVVLQHGLFGQSSWFLINSPGGFAADWTEKPIKANLSTEGRNLGYLLANFGYDVWLINSRGNLYSRNHTTLNPDKDHKYWEFSFDEMIDYDTPAIIDYVLEKTGHENVALIGYSQGTIVGFGFLADLPEYSSKVKPYIAMAPMAHVEHTTSPIKYLIRIPGIVPLMKAHGGEFTMPKSFIKLFGQQFCGQTVGSALCSSGLFLLCGYDSVSLNKTREAVYITQALGGTSWWDFVHLTQNMLSKRFEHFDYGRAGNIRKYGTPKPPLFRLDKIVSEDIVLMIGQNDPVADAQDIDILRKTLQVPFTEYTVIDPKFNHLDFVWSEHTYDYVYKTTLDVIKKYD